MIVNKQARRQAKQLFHFCSVNGLLDEDRVRQVVEHIVSSGYRSSPAILAHFMRLLKLDRAQHMAKVESATPLPADLQATTQAGLTRRYGPGLTITFAERPSLIGGMRIQVGSDVYDGTVLAGLTALEKSF